MLKDSLVRKVSLFTDLLDSDLRLIADITLRRALGSMRLSFMPMMQGQPCLFFNQAW